MSSHLIKISKVEFQYIWNDDRMGKSINGWDNIPFLFETEVLSTDFSSSSIFASRFTFWTGSLHGDGTICSFSKNLSMAPWANWSTFLLYLKHYHQDEITIAVWKHHSQLPKHGHVNDWVRNNVFSPPLIGICICVRDAITITWRLTCLVVSSFLLHHRSQ